MKYTTRKMTASDYPVAEILQQDKLHNKEQFDDLFFKKPEIIKKKTGYKVPKFAGQATKEADLLKDCKKILEDNPEAWVQRVDGVGKMYAGRMIASSHAGFPDLVCIIRGVFYAIELKAAGGTLSELQARMLLGIIQARGNAAIVTSVSGLHAFLRLDVPHDMVHGVPVY